MLDGDAAVEVRREESIVLTVLFTSVLLFELIDTKR